MSESPGPGTMPPQFAAVLQLSSVPPPVHVTVAARPGISTVERAIANRAVFIDSLHNTIAVRDVRSLTHGGFPSCQTFGGQLFASVAFTHFGASPVLGVWCLNFQRPSAAN